MNTIFRLVPTHSSTTVDTEFILNAYYERIFEVFDLSVQVYKIYSSQDMFKVFTIAIDKVRD